MPSAFGFMSPADGNSEQNALDFMVRQIIKAEIVTAALVIVRRVDTQVHRLAVEPMVQQVTPDGQPIPHGQIFDVPYGYVQGGNCLIRLDPQVGDMGLIVCTHRDISRVKATRKPTPPATIKSHDWSDAVYVQTLWAARPAEHIIRVAPDGITMSSPRPVQIQADLNVSGTITAGGDVKGGGISLQSHVHGGVQPGSGTTGKPQ